jgi:hypothetical protein
MLAALWARFLLRDFSRALFDVFSKKFATSWDHALSRITGKRPPVSEEGEEGNDELEDLSKFALACQRKLA